MRSYTWVERAQRKRMHVMISVGEACICDSYSPFHSENQRPLHLHINTMIEILVSSLVSAQYLHSAICHAPFAIYTILTLRLTS